LSGLAQSVDFVSEMHHYLKLKAENCDSVHWISKSQERTADARGNQVEAEDLATSQFCNYRPESRRAPTFLV
jgi:hypothetical protein